MRLDLGHLQAPIDHLLHWQKEDHHDRLRFLQEGHHFQDQFHGHFQAQQVYLLLRSFVRR